METLCLHPHRDYYNHRPRTNKKSMLQFYEPLNVISQGSYGVVWRAKDKKIGEIVAMKHELHGLSRSTIREIEILRSLPPHPSIVGFKRVIQDDDDRVFVVMEYLKTDLSRFMVEKRRALTLVEVRLVMKQIMEGVNYLHENGVMHRDIKPSNILMNNILDLKICDFGLSRSHVGSESGSYTPGVVTLWYRAPELLLGSERYTKAIDIWSVGCIMAELVLNQVLFPGQSELMQFRSIHDQIVSQGGSALRHKVAAAAACSRGPLLTPQGLDLLQKLLAFEPGKRISAKDALNHNWFKGL
ncbi:hypothetical protein ACS0TY_000491 [Phlomoides rotata]